MDTIAGTDTLPIPNEPMLVMEALGALPDSHILVLLGALLMSAIACSAGDVPSESCTDGDRVLNVGFYAFFDPVSHSADPDPASEGFNTHLGYEADLLTALEAMEGAGLSFSRRGIASWDDIWLQSADAGYDIVGGGITILDSRTRDAAGEKRSSHSRRAT